jgi:putative solute:sodium symporter small subunit
MFDSDTLRPVIIAMIIYFVLTTFVPKIIQKPTGVELVDNEVMYLMAQKGSLVSGLILIGLIVYLTNYTNNELI